MLLLQNTCYRSKKHKCFLRLDFLSRKNTESKLNLLSVIGYIYPTLSSVQLSKAPVFFISSYLPQPGFLIFVLVFSAAVPY